MPNGICSGKKFEDAKLTNCIPANTETKSIEMNAIVKCAFFFTLSPNLTLALFCDKRVFVKVS